MYHTTPAMNARGTKEAVMSRDIQTGRWLQIRGRAKRAWGELVGNDTIAAEGNADVVAGAVEESIGVAKREAAREIARGADALAGYAKKAARAIAR
jgi:uncharacterized protein YjbJ (UPF0337 family)